MGDVTWVHVALAFVVGLVIVGVAWSVAWRSAQEERAFWKNGEMPWTFKMTPTGEMDEETRKKMTDEFEKMAKGFEEARVWFEKETKDAVERGNIP